ncbi:MAG TPA: hydroxymethylbilane synthase [Chloroflexota bacterium]|nr:hydroxymethylbilane synthase [Chloroflexota bacterium]
MIGTRRSRLALWQTEHVAARLRAQYPDVEITLQTLVTQGDRLLDTPLPALGGKGVFTADLETALRTGQIDLAVHSLKDLPTELSEEFAIGAVLERGSPYDALLSRDGQGLMALPVGATVGTSSPRRVAQVKAARPDLFTSSLRGNVPTRIEKLRRPGGPYDAIVLAVAGLERLGLRNDITETLPPEVMLPAPGQGALAVQCRAGDRAVQEMLERIDHPDSRRATAAERAFLRRLDAGCHLPVAALGVVEGESMVLLGRVCSADGRRVIDVRAAGPVRDAEALGHDLAGQALERGAAELLAAAEGAVAR